jgi:protein ImuB
MFAAIYIHDFSLQSALRHEPELIPKTVVLMDPALTKPCVIQLTPTARASGICEGMSPSQAMARCGNLLVKTRSLPQEQAAMEVLMQTAYAFSPYIEATLPGVCTIELKGLAIQSNESAAKEWAAEILRVLKQFHLDGQIGFAETPDLALLAARAAEQDSDIEIQERATDFVSRLPIEALDLPFEHFEILKHWGISTVGTFLALGKVRLAERLGPDIIKVFDRLSTHSIRPLKIAPPPETFAEEIEFENPIETLEPLLFILRRFVEQLSRRIELLYLVVAELHLKLGLTSGAGYERIFTIPSPTGSPETLFRTLHTHLENVRTDAPIASLRLSAKPGGPESHQFGLFETTLRNPNQFAETLARLAALCGSDRVGTPVPEATHRPDAFRMQSADFSQSREKERSASLPGSQHTQRCDRRGMGLNAPMVSQRLRAGTARAPAVSERISRGLPLRRFRPPLSARVEFRERRPVLIRSAVFNGVIADARGPFFNSGNWWENNRWWREEWDVEAADGSLYRIFLPAEEIDDHDSSPKSGIELPHSKTLREIEESQKSRQVLECGSPMPLLFETDKRAQCLQSPSSLLQYFVEGVYD